MTSFANTRSIFSYAIDSDISLIFQLTITPPRKQKGHNKREVLLNTIQLFTEETMYIYIIQEFSIKIKKKK